MSIISFKLIAKKYFFVSPLLRFFFPVYTAKNNIYIIVVLWKKPISYSIEKSEKYISMVYRTFQKHKILCYNTLCNNCWPYVIQYNKRYILSTFEKIEIFALSNRRLNKLSNDTKFIKIKVILLKVQLLQSVYFLLFSNLADTFWGFCCIVSSHIFLILGLNL